MPDVSKYLNSIAPFSYLSEETLYKVSNQITITKYKQNTILFTQAISKVSHLYIIQKGALEIFFDDGKQKTLQGFLGEGENFGGISMLLNNSLSIRTVRVHEDSVLLQLPKVDFLDLCRKNEEFSSFFTDSFGKRMLDKSYATIISKALTGNINQDISVINEKISNIEISQFTSCPITTSIQEAASKMSQQKTSALLVRESNEFIGIVTDKDFREKVIINSISSDQPVTSIMSAPLISVPVDTPIFEALFLMIDKKIKHLVLHDTKNRIIGIISDHDLVLAQGQSPLHLLQKIATSESDKDLFTLHTRFPQIIRVLIQNGARANIVNRYVTRLSDEILKKLVTMAIKENGPAPVPFVFMIMGSEGRREQTLKTDQDNAIIYDDVGEQDASAIQDYFIKLGQKVCGWLDKAGYSYCKGEVMAQNPKWCQPLQVWKNYFSKWINTPEPLALMHASIFFDFRSGYGDEALIEKLRHHLHKLLSGRVQLFYYHLAKNALQFKPPLGFFRNFVVESQGKHKNAFDIKKAMTPIVDFTRLYALNHKISETNTLNRLEALSQLSVFEKQEYEDLNQAYTFLMQLRFSRQLNAIINEKSAPDNYIIPNNLNHIEQRVLKEIFTLIEKFQQKMSMKFTAMA